MIDVDQGDAGGNDQGDADDTDPRKKLQSELQGLNGGLGISPTMAGGRGDPLGAPKVDYEFRRFGFNPPAATTPLRRQALIDMAGAYGVPAPMIDERASAAAFREAFRIFGSITIPALGQLIAVQLGEALGVPELELTFPTTTDLATKARSLQAMVNAGMKGTDNIRAEIHSKGSAPSPRVPPSRPPGAGDRRRRETGAVLSGTNARSGRTVQQHGT